MRLTACSNSHYTMQSEEISAIVVPQEGGRIASLKSLASGLEFLTQSHRQGEFPVAGLSASFRNGACAGIEECLPTVAPCGPEAEGSPIPDHGDFWQIPWSVLVANDNGLTIEADGFSRPLRFRKTLNVQTNTLWVRYSIRNTGATPQPFLYACHPLFAVEMGDRVVLPIGTRTLRLDYSRYSRLGERGDLLSWPVTDAEVVLNVARDNVAGTADMLYTSRLLQGVCGIERVSQRQMLEVLFPVDKLPYLGIWLCYGGWPEDSASTSQYAVALEPTTAPWNSLAEAQVSGDAVLLEPDETYGFDIAFRITASHQDIPNTE